MTLINSTSEDYGSETASLRSNVPYSIDNVYKHKTTDISLELPRVTVLRSIHRKPDKRIADHLCINLSIIAKATESVVCVSA
jgi:hypothetical protein